MAVTWFFSPSFLGKKRRLYLQNIDGSHDCHLVFACCHCGRELLSFTVGRERKSERRERERDLSAFKKIFHSSARIIKKIST